jgi:DNA-binding NarL/FixJ family response regulator
MIKVLIADNQVLTNQGITTLLSTISDIRIIGKAIDVIELEQMIIKLKPDVVIIDHDYSNHFDIQDLKNIHTEFSASHILVLSNRQHKQEILELLEHGIKNYLSKMCSRDELLQAVYAAAKNELYLCPATTKTVYGDELSQTNIEIPELSSRETEIIHLIAEGLTNKEIADKLFLSFHTIKSHRKNIIKKLGFSFKNAAELSSLIQLLQ